MGLSVIAGLSVFAVAPAVAQEDGAQAVAPIVVPAPQQPEEQNPLGEFGGQVEKEPPMPLPLREAIRGGAQARYLGKHEGLNGWVLLKRGQPEFHYATEDGKAIVMGILFDGDGNMVTGEQMRMLRLREGAMSYALSDLVNTKDPVKAILPEAAAPKAAAPVNPLVEAPKAGVTSGTDQAIKGTSAADAFYTEVESGNWVRLGDAGAPILYAFIDPDCDHCQGFLKDVYLPYVERGVIQLRVLPVGFTEMGLKRAAYLLASPQPEDQLIRYVSGERQALFVPGAIQTEGAEKNVTMMNKWRLSGTPVLTYKNKDGVIRLLRGRPENPAAIVDEISTKW